MAHVTPPARTLITHVDGAKLAGRVAALTAALADATPAGHRPPELLVASKYYAPEVLPQLVAAGVTLLGENRAEALEAKQAATAGADVQWDFIGELQSRKAAAIAAQVSRIHSLASSSAVRKLRAAAAQGAPMPQLLVQVNVAEEAGKGGIAPADLPEFLEAAGELPVAGLMTMPPLAAEPAQSRRWFAALRELAERHGLVQLSMGTSQDVLVAAQEGATVVRVGGVLHSDERWAALGLGA